MRRFLTIIALMALPCAAQAKKAGVPPPACSGPVKPQIFLSPMGEPFRPGPDGGEPVRIWFDQADRDHDGWLTSGEMQLDADRFFASLDKDGNGELLPDEVGAYEEVIAPEVRLYQPRRPADPGAKRDDESRDARRERSRPAGFGGAIGGGRYAFLNIPNPVASADDDINRAVDRAEFRAAAAERFRDLDPQQRKALALADLPKTPAQTAANASCLQRVKDGGKGGR